jgi:hypothetical protein
MKPRYTSNSDNIKRKREQKNSVENTVEILVAFLDVFSPFITTRSYPHFQEKNQVMVLIVFCAL